MPRFKPGDVVKTHKGALYNITSVDKDIGLYYYKVIQSMNAETIGMTDDVLIMHADVYYSLVEDNRYSTPKCTCGIERTYKDIYKRKAPDHIHSWFCDLIRRS